MKSQQLVGGGRGGGGGEPAERMTKRPIKCNIGWHEVLSHDWIQNPYAFSFHYPYFYRCTCIVVFVYVCKCSLILYDYLWYRVFVLETN